MRRIRQLNLVLMLKMENAFDRLAFSGIASAAHASSDTLLHLCNGSSFDEAMERYDVDGIVVSTDQPEWIDAVSATGKPCVNVTNYLQGQAKVPVVGTDDEAIGRMAAQHYLERGFRHFACFINPDAWYFFPRRDGFVRALQEAGFGCAIGPYTLPATGVDPWTKHWTEFAGRWLASLPRPLALMSPVDATAREAVLACNVAGLRVPEDISIIGVDNDEILCMTVWPQLSSVVTPAKWIGVEAMRLLRTMILEGAPRPAAPLVFPPSEIFVRGSSSETAVEDPDVAMAVNFIRDHVSQQLSVRDLVEHTAISRRALERRFYKALGRTPMDEIRRARIERAKRLLLETDLTLAEVARRSGLGRQQRLCSVLKADTGRTPLQFRSHMRPVA